MGHNLLSLLLVELEKARSEATKASIPRDDVVQSRVSAEMKKLADESNAVNKKFDAIKDPSVEEIMDNRDFNLTNGSLYRNYQRIAEESTKTKKVETPLGEVTRTARDILATASPIAVIRQQLREPVDEQ